MTKFHYLSPPVDGGTSSPSVMELSRRVTDSATDLPALCACANELALLPYSSSAEQLGGTIREAMQEWMMRQDVPQSYPMSPTDTARWQLLESGWRALARTQVHWKKADGQRVEVRSATEALFCLRQIVLLCGLTHWPVPEGLWLDVHHIYFSSLEQGTVRQRLRKSFLRHRYRTSIEWEYIQTVMLGMTDPYNLLPQEVLALDSLGEKWVAMVKLHSGGQPGWVVDENADEPAAWRISGEGLRLEFAKLMEFLDSQHELASTVGRYEWIEHPEDTIPVALLDHWRRIWSHPAAAGKEKLNFDQAELEIGLEAIFGRLQGGHVSGASVVDTGSEWLLKGSENVQVGDLVGIFSGALQGLALISRLCSGREDNGEIRLQLHQLEGQVFAVGIQPLYRGDKPCAYQRGLLLAHNERLILILALQPVAEGTVVRLLLGSKMYPVRLLQTENIARGLLGCVCESAAGQIQK